MESASERRYTKRASSRRTAELSESEGSAGDPFTPRIRYFDFPKTRMPSHIKTYNGSEDPEDHLKIFQSAAKTQRDGESTEEFVRRYKLECRDVKGAPECIKISGSMHEITNPELIKRLHDKIPKSVDEMMRVTTAFLRGEVAASNRERKKPFSSWKQQEANQKKNFKKGGYQNQQRLERKQDRFFLLTKTPKEIFALDKGKFKALPPMTTPKRIEEMLKAGKLSHLIKELKQINGKEQPKVTKKGETSGKDKALAILMIQPWERVARQKIT
ncbi:hypothetical protein Tco_0997331 [Tanacetum coccineum]